MALTKDMTQGNIYKVFLTYSIPLLFSYFLSQAYSTIDAMIAGKFISEHALGAISATGSFDLLLYALFSGFATGFGIYIAQLFGHGDYTTLKQGIVSNGIFIFLFSLSISTFSVILRNPILDYLRVDPILRDDAELYFTIYTTGYALPYLNLLLVQALYSLGCTSFSVYVSLIAAAVKIGGNLLSVFVFDFEVAGLAIFSILSNAVATVCYLFLLKKAFRELPSKGSPFSLRFFYIKNSLKYALPAAIQQAAFSGVAVLIAPVINGLGAEGTTAFNVSTRIYDLATTSLLCVTNAFSCYTAQCIGQNSYRKIPAGIKAGFILNLVVLLPFVLLFVFLAKPITAMFFPTGYTGTDFHNVIRYATYFLPFVYIQLIGHVLHAYMRSLGAVNTVLYITLFYGLVRVIATNSLVPSMNIDGVFWGQIISWTADAIVSVAITACLFRTNEQLRAITERVRRKHLCNH